jgi:hypothetical protein
MGQPDLSDTGELLETIAARVVAVKKWIEGDAAVGDTLIAVHSSALGEALEAVDELRMILNVPVPGAV